MTCLCLTRNRRNWLPKAIDCFLAQTYPRRELLIVADGEDVADLVPQDERIRLLHVTGQTEIGEKRNFGCEHAYGDLIAHWDDDDFSAPGRLADQVGRLRESGKAVTGYHSMRFTDGARWWQYINNPGFSLGTALLYRREWWASNRFPNKHIGEDNDFGGRAQQQGQMISVDAGDLMYATVHPGNTSPRPLSGTNWKEIECNHTAARLSAV